MRLPRIYLDSKLTQGAHLVLPSETRHHLVNVLRLKVGAQLILFNGKSQQEAIANITYLDRKSATVSVQSIEDTCRESFLDISLVQAISSTDKMDFTIQKSVELGVKSIQPLFTERSQKAWKTNRLEKKLAHWNGILVHACEQSGRTLLPQLYPPASYQDYLRYQNSNRFPLMLDPGASQSLEEIDTRPTRIDLLIGPEGGFSSQEIFSAGNADIITVKIGPRILRTETASIVAITQLQSKFGDLGC